MLKTRLIRAAIFLLSGAVISVGVAWTAAATTDLAGGRVFELYTGLDESHHWEVFRWERGAGTRIMSTTWRGFAPGPYNEGDPETLLAWWDRIDPPDRDRPLVATQVDEAWGFPLPALTCKSEARETPAGMKTTTTANVIRLSSYGRALPLEPLWRGLATNTVVYALCVFVILALARDARGTIRRGTAGNP